MPAAPPVTIGIPVPLLAALDRLAAQRGISRSEAVRVAVEAEVGARGEWPPAPSDAPGSHGAYTAG